MTKTIAYLRVSTEKQNDQGCSLETQKAQCEAYASLYNLEIVEFITDICSAKSLDRPGLSRALKLLSDGTTQALLVTKLDRLTRSVHDLGELVSGPFAGSVALLSVGEQIDTRSSAGRLVLNVLASVSQWEREAIGERTRAVMQYKKAKGEYIGGHVPYGWAMFKGSLWEVPKEQEVLRRARELKELFPGASLQALSHALKVEGCLARNGKPFKPMQVKRMLESE